LDITGLAVTFDKATVDVPVRVTDNGKLRSGQVELVPRMGSLQLTNYCSPNRDLTTKVGLPDPPRFLFRRVLPGTYDVVVINTHLEGQYLEDIRQGERSIFDSGLVIGDTTPDPVEVILRSGGGSVEVWTQGERTRLGTLLLLPDPLHENRSLYQEINTQGSTSFTFENVRPGRYKVFAFEGVANGSELILNTSRNSLAREFRLR
jgi:hypothetical protein